MKKLTGVIMYVLLLCCMLFGNVSASAASKVSVPKDFKGSTVITKEYETVLTMTWSKVDGADGYQVYYRDQVGGEDKWGSWELIATTNKTTTQEFIIDGEFQMKIRAYKGSIYSDYTETITVLGGKGIISGPKADIDVKMNKSKANVNVGSTVKIKVENATGKISWKSSNTKIATVSSNGTVKGIKAGEANITAIVKNKKLTCKVTVKKVSINTSYKEILNTNISDSKAFALLDINKDGIKELLVYDQSSGASASWYTTVYSYYNGKIYDSKVGGMGKPSYLSSKKGIVTSGMFSSNEWLSVDSLEKGKLTTIYSSGSHFVEDKSTGDWVMGALLNGKDVSDEEREKADNEMGFANTTSINFYTITKDNINKYVK